MSISPAISFSIVSLAAPSEGPSQNSPHSHVQSDPSPSESGRVHGAEVQAPKNDPPPSQLPEDEVQLQRDSQLQEELIVRYMDKSGNLILQVPSAQTLDFQRAIAAEFDQAQSRASNKSIDLEGESRGH
jgi:hypothetical protein